MLEVTNASDHLVRNLQKKIWNASFQRSLQEFPSAAFESLDVVMEKLGLEVEAMIRPPQFPKETKSWFALGRQIVRVTDEQVYRGRCRSSLKRPLFGDGRTQSDSMRY